MDGSDTMNEANILAGHFASTRDRFAAKAGFPMLVLHDTTELSFTRENLDAVGVLQKLTVGYAGKYRTTCGILMHSSLVTTADGLPLGLAAIEFWNRDKFHGANALTRTLT